MGGLSIQPLPGSGLSVQPLPGTGVLVRLGGLVLVCAATGAEELVRIATQVHEEDGDGRELSRRLMRWAIDRERADLACVMVGTTGEGRVALLAYGAASIVGTVDGASFAMTGADSDHPVTRLIGGILGSVQLRLAGTSGTDPLLRLDGGVIRAGGAEITGFATGALSDREAAAAYNTEPMSIDDISDVDPGPAQPLLPAGGQAPRRALPAAGDLPRRVPQPVPGAGEPVRYGGLSADPSAPPSPSEPVATEPMSAPYESSVLSADPPPAVAEQLQLSGPRSEGVKAPEMGDQPQAGPWVGGQAEGAGQQPPAPGPVPVGGQVPAGVHPGPGKPVVAVGRSQPVAPSRGPAGGQPAGGQPAVGQPAVGQPAAVPPQLAAVPAQLAGGQPRAGGQGPARGGGLAAVLRERTRHHQPVLNPAPHSSALRYPDRGAAYQAVLLVEGSVSRDDMPAATPPTPPVMVEGVACSRDHLNPPGTQWCHVCSTDIPPGSQLRQGPRPALGILVLDNAMSFVLDADYVAGREPQIDRDVAAGDARPLLVTDPEGIVSRRHIRVHLDGWQVSLMDLGSANGTQVHRPGRPHPETVPRGSSVLIEPGTEISLGSRRLRFEAHSLVNMGT